MSTTKIKQGMTIRLRDPIRIGVRFWDATRQCVVGTGGEAVPRTCLEQAGAAADVRHGRVRIVWPVLIEPGLSTTKSMWLDVDQVEPAPGLAYPAWA